MATELGQTFLEPGLFAGPYPSGAPALFADTGVLCRRRVLQNKRMRARALRGIYEYSVHS